MLKFMKRDDDGRCIVGLGLTPENVALLKQFKPIAFDAAEVGIDQWAGRMIVIAYLPKDTIPIPTNPQMCCLLALNDQALSKLREQLYVIEVPHEPVTFLMFYGEHAVLEAMMRDKIGPQTRVSRTGFAPGDPRSGMFSDN